MKSLFLAIICTFLVVGCDDGGGFLGGSGPVVEYSFGCGDRGVACPGGDINYDALPDEDGRPTISCKWKCAMYGGEIDNDVVRDGERGGSYLLIFKQKPDGCWELDWVGRGFPHCG